MTVTMMDVRVIRMRVDEFFVAVPVRVRLAGRAMGVLMVLVVGVQVLMFHQLMLMDVLVAFGQVQPDAESRQEGGDAEADGQPVPKNKIEMAAPTNGATEK